MSQPPLIFLDIDGVLNAHDYDDAAKSCLIDPKCVRNFNRILDETDARIVLSSAWRYMIAGGAITLKGFEYLLRTHGVHCVDRLIGITVADEVIRTRGDQIKWWLHAQWSEDPCYLVIDDGGTDPETGEWHDMHIEVVGHPVLWTDGKKGLTRDDAIRAIKILDGEEEADSMTRAHREWEEGIL